MIIEYKGEIVTPAVADMREQRYRSASRAVRDDLLPHLCLVP